MLSATSRRAAFAAFNLSLSLAWNAGAQSLEPAATAAADAAAAQGAIALPPVEVESPEAGSLLDTPLTRTDVSSDALKSKRAQTSDSARLLEDVPSVTLYEAGGVSSLPVIHGQADDRVNVLVNGMPLTSACSNHMNPPLSYIDPTNVGTAAAITGITPVSMGGDSTGGTIIVDSPSPVFAGEGETIRFGFEPQTFYRSNGDNYAVAVGGTVANDTYSLNYAGAWTQAEDYRGGGDDGRVRSTEYEAFNQSLSMAARGDNDLLVVQLGHQYIPYQGFPNQYMDMTDNRSYVANIGYDRSFSWGKLDARTFVQSIDHEMNFLNDKGGTSGGGMPMKADAINTGYRVAATIPLNERDTVRIGNEFYHFTINDRWRAVPGSMMMGPDRYVSINDGTRDRLGTFAEWEAHWSKNWSTLLGTRNDNVWMDTGDVQPYDSTAGMMNPDADAAEAFNDRSHARVDINFDLTALARYSPDDNSTYEFGLARKTRSPNLYERYAWGTGAMSSSMIGWFGDGNGYYGDIDLQPEVAHTVSATADWHDNGDVPWQVQVTPYYTYIKDYIGVEKRRDFTDMNGNPTGFSQFQFANHDAQFYGVDLSAQVQLWNSDDFGRGIFKGLVGWIEGEDLEVNEDAYHLMPLHGKLALDHALGSWASAIELVLVNDKSNVDGSRGEQYTSEYALLNLRTTYQWRSVRFYFGIQNVFDSAYDLPLGGVSLGDYGATGDLRAVPGPGRSFVVGASLQW